MCYQELKENKLSSEKKVESATERHGERLKW